MQMPEILLSQSALHQRIDRRYLRLRTSDFELPSGFGIRGFGFYLLFGLRHSSFPT